ncbi:MAG: M20/M25/M40 family metallo-hydrolase [Planctomycetota bacterium]|nr:M20/M25/M40 family metallo-hydrolase [Planctomycetota bacterium]
MARMPKYAPSPLNDSKWMVVLTASILGLAGFTAAQSAWGQSTPPTVSVESKFITQPRQVTFEGKRAGEGYFGADNSQMVFQSERREDNPFFQIYLLDFEIGEIEPISPGHGKTTCAWLHPDGKKVLYSSTQDDPNARQKQREEIEFRESGQSRRYSWDYDEHYEIYSYDTDSKQYQRLTNERGYDAEGSYSPDGKMIAFASNRHAYSKPMTEEQKKAFELDPAYMMDIFIMNSDGSNVRQLTEVPGYDGGPFFSPDGKRICWRRFSENGAIAEIMTMNIDGSDQRKLTNIGAMSWAPFYHPSGKYLIFTTNRHGFANFELYLVDADGKSPPVRVTDTEGFDGLASFSPDGSKLTWTSNRNDKKESQIYLAEWNHNAALQALAVGDDQPSEWASATRSGQGAAEATTPSFDQADLIKHVDYLCREELGGRMTGSPGEKKATAYVAAYLDSLGIQADGDNGTWYQNFEFPAGSRLGPDNQLSSRSESGSQERGYELDREWRPLSFSGTGKIQPASVVFAGYGIVAPPAENQEEYDSYVHLDVKDKWVLVFRYMPENISAERRQYLQYHSSLRKKAMEARDKGARGIIVVSGPNSNVKNELVPLQNDFANAGSSVAAMSISDDVANRWLSAQGKDLQALQERLDTGQPMMGFPIKNLELGAAIDVEQVVGRGRNVIGRLMVGDEPAEQAVLVGAHIDHLGRGTGGSLAKNEERNMVHVGADDNASGVAAMLEVAEYLADLKRKGKLDMKRDVIFAAWSGEELGLHGSQHFVNQLLESRPNAAPSRPTPKPIPEGTNPHDITIEQIGKLIETISNELPTMDRQKLRSSIVELTLLSQFMEQGIKSFDAQIKASDDPDQAADWRRQRNEISDTWDQAQTVLIALNKAEASAVDPNESQPAKSIYPTISSVLNMDMVGRMEKQLVLQGIGSSDYWAGDIEKRNAVVGLPIKLNQDTQLPTDASSFYRAGVPILSAFTGSHTDYHTPRDTPEKLNYPAATRIAKLMGLVARGLVVNEQVPGYIRQSAQEKKQSRGVMRAYLGTVPDYASDEKGVLLSDVTTGAPADQAGVQGGDIIVELAGRKIENIYDFTYAIEALKIGQETNIIVLRGEKRLEMKIVPGSRE